MEKPNPQIALVHQLEKYANQKRAVRITQHLLWLAMIISLTPKSVPFILELSLALIILARSLWILLQPTDLVAIATEIEQLHPEFDQRLITAATPQSRSPLLDTLVNEVTTLFNTRPGQVRVPLRNLLLPTILLALLILLKISGIIPRHR